MDGPVDKAALIRILPAAAATALLLAGCAREGDTTPSGKLKIPEKAQSGVAAPESERPKQSPNPPG